MKSCTVQKAYLVCMLMLTLFVSSVPGYARAAASPVDLGAATTFGGFGGGAGMTNQGIFTVVNGDIGTTGWASSVTGFHDTGATVYTETPSNVGTVNGTIHTADTPLGSVPNAIATAVALAAEAAYINLSPAALPGGIDVSSLGGAPDALGNRTLSPGVYTSAPGEFYIQGGDLYLDAHGDSNAVWVFQMSSTLTVGGPGAAFPQSVILVNGAQAKNVFWQVGSFATINAGGGGTMVGTIISYAGVAFSTVGNVNVVTLEGRALALHASVTLVNTVINVPASVPAPVALTAIAPTGSGVIPTAAFTFTGVADAAQYVIYLQDYTSATGGPVSVTPVQAGCDVGTACSYTPVTPLIASHIYGWAVATVNAAGQGPWSATLNFDTTTIPTVLTPNTPIGSGAAISTAFTFTGVTNATGYVIYLQDYTTATGGPISITPAQAGCDVGTACSYTPAVSPLTASHAYGWGVAAVNAAGQGPWSVILNFDTSTIPAAPAALTHSGSSATTAAFTFTGVPGATGYVIYLQDYTTATGGPVSITPAQAGCAAGTACSYTPTVTPLTTLHSYGWGVAATNAAGQGPYSAIQNFDVL